jgi:hypothetical protein
LTVIIETEIKKEIPESLIKDKNIIKKLVQKGWSRKHQRGSVDLIPSSGWKIEITCKTTKNAGYMDSDVTSVIWKIYEKNKLKYEIRLGDDGFGYLPSTLIIK